GEKKETARDHQHRRSLWTAVAREDRQESFGGNFRNGSARRFPGIQLSNGIWRNLVSARCARQKLSHPRAIDRPVQRCELFGCGGNRDREKRPLMGQVVDQNADYAVITSDNPRKEDPDKIIAEIEKGFRGNHFEKITDRASAISRAIEIAQPRDIVLIAGKG